jgi:endoglucanase
MSRFAWILALFAAFAPIDRALAETAVEKHGQLRVQGNRIVDKSGAPVQLRGMSLFWSQWIPKYYNAATIQWLRDDWKIRRSWSDS